MRLSTAAAHAMSRHQLSSRRDHDLLDSVNFSVDNGHKLLRWLFTHRQPLLGRGREDPSDSVKCKS
jgi:hypothetical protein